MCIIKCAQTKVSYIDTSEDKKSFGKFNLMIKEANSQIHNPVYFGFE